MIATNFYLSILRKTTIFISLSCASILAISFDSRATPNDVNWLRSTSLVGERCSGYTGTLYRGLRGNYFPMSRIVMNMLGDHTAEEGSWRMSAMSEGLPQPIDTATWENLKLQAGDELRSEIAVKESCKVAKEAMKDTIIGNSIEEKQLAKAIATSSNFNEASQYAAMTAYQGEHTTPDGASVIWINEHVQRAAHVTGTEYFLPILIPAEDITQGWYKAVRAVKEASAEETKQITFYEDAIPKESIPRSKPIAKIISCASDGLCDSDAQFLRYPALEEIYSSLQSKTFDGKRYKLVAPNL